MEQKVNVPSTILMVYVGDFQESERFGKVSGNRYIFNKDKFGLPIALEVDIRDKDALLAERGAGCATHDPTKLFMTLLQWNVELDRQRQVNR